VQLCLKNNGSGLNGIRWVCGFIYLYSGMINTSLELSVLIFGKTNLFLAVSLKWGLCTFVVSRYSKTS
jgi:hypothetical protein